MKTFTKDPQAVLDYKFDWAALTNGTGTSDWLQASETITSYAITADTGLTVDSSSITDAGTSVTVWLSSGSEGNSYMVSCTITTSQGRTDERSIVIDVEQR